MSQISIPKPCHENWDNMLPEAQGKHCLACSKTVIDFSAWEVDEIQAYLQRRSGEKVCGRFNATQIDQTNQHNEVLPFIISSNVSLLKKIAAIVLLCFGVMAGTDSHAQKVTGGPVYQPARDTFKMVTGEPSIHQEKIMGKPALPAPKDSVKTKPIAPKCEPQIMGMIRQYPVPKTTKVKQSAPAPKSTKASPKK